MEIYFVTSDKYIHLMKGAAIQFNKYWSRPTPVKVLGYKPPDFSLPSNFTFISLGDQKAYNNSWTDPLRDYLNTTPESHFLLMLEDYWLTHPVDQAKVEELEKEVTQFGVSKADLSYDVGLYKTTRYKEKFLCSLQTTRYRNSLQAAIWNKDYFMKFLKPGWSPWEFELKGMRLAFNDGATIISFPEEVVRYANIYLKGKVLEEHVNRIPQEDMKVLREQGCLGFLDQ